MEKATRIIDDFGKKLVREHDEKYLDGVFERVERRVETMVQKASRRHFWRGVFEATVGAFCWMVILLIVVMGAYLLGIDLLHGIANLAGAIHRP